MGLEEESMERANRFVEQRPDDVLIPRVMFWIGSRHLAKQRYDEARRIFNELAIRHPGSPETVDAERYLESLNRLDEGEKIERAGGSN
jgi:TolA-binding protein